MSKFTLFIEPRNSISWEKFQKDYPKYSIALDGFVNDAPNYNEQTKHINFDHHHGVVREATMATADQVYMAVKGGLFQSFKDADGPVANIYVNDPDQDTCLAVFILLHHDMFEGTKSIPHFNRLLNLDSKFDITGGAYPVNLRDELLESHAWVFQPYTDLRTSGKLASAGESEIRDCIEAVCARIMKFIMGESGKLKLDTRHTILNQSSALPGFMLVEEIGGNSARYHLFSLGMNAFISIVAKRPDGKYVYSLGRRSMYIPFPVKELFEILNKEEGLTRENGWGGSDIIGGSSRSLGSSLEPEKVFEIVETYLKQK